MIDNFEQIKTLLDFPSEDTFYFAQILLRKKDNPETSGNNNSARLIKAYYIKSIEHLDKVKDEMILLANKYNARVCINLNKRSFERAAFHTLKKITDQILNKDYKSVRRAYNSACGEYSTGDKRWIVDIDDKKNTRFYVAEYIRDLEPNPGESKVITYVETKSGWHIITKPFNISKFKEVYPEIDVHKNNPTILYIPKWIK
jgi:hypothetical protein